MTKVYDTPYGTFEWDETKAARNLKKHGISFETAAHVFSDPFMHTVADVEHSYDEERSKVVGHAGGALFVLVVFTYRQSIRIISARKANKKERGQYYAKS